MTIKEIREKTGLSRKEFSDLLGIPVGTIRNWEQGIRQPAPYICTLIEKVVFDKVNDK